MKKILLMVLAIFSIVAMLLVSGCGGDIYSNAKIGDIVPLGKIKNTKLGVKEDLKWRVIEVKGDRKLLLCCRSVGCLPMNSQNLLFGNDRTPSNSPWNGTIVRKWLNKYFLNQTFSQEEFKRILKTQIITQGEMGYRGLKYDVKTDDYLFCLTSSEVKKYLPNEYDRKRDSCMFWWLRDMARTESEGHVHFRVIYSHDGTFDTMVENNLLVDVVPAMWIKCE